MKKTTLLSAIITLTAASFAHAGAMGDANGGCCSGFVSLEGGFSWNNLDGYHFAIVGTNSTLNSIEKNSGGTARLAAGVMSMFDDQWGATGELGWGYYGQTSYTPFATGLASEIPVSLSIKHTLSGFDALVGLAFVQPYFTLSLKAGALIQNLQTNSTSIFAPIAPLFNEYNVKTNTTAVLPEIKIGAAYNFDSNWSITAAYALAIGSSPQTTGILDASTGDFRATLNINQQNPTLNTALLGIQYTC